MEMVIKERVVLMPPEILGTHFALNRGKDNTSWIISFRPFCGKKIKSKMSDWYIITK